MAFRVLKSLPKHEKFYHDIVASAVTNDIKDAELVAILSLIIGRAIGAAKPGEDKDTMRDTALANITQGAGEIKGLLKAVGKGH